MEGKPIKITVLGAGAMGSLFGGYLSQHNDVWLVDVDQNKINKIVKNGITISETYGDRSFWPKAVGSTQNLCEMDLIIVFVKAMYTADALRQNQHLIGKNTYVMTLQNGAGHEATLLQFVTRDHIIIGTTQHNSSLIASGHIHHGGGGMTVIGLLDGNSDSLKPIADVFTECGFLTTTGDNVKKQIWQKLFLNVSASALTAVLQVPLGFILENPYACSLMERLVTEAVEVANTEGIANFESNQVIEDVKAVLKGAPDGYTSIYTDVKNGVRTEVDTISGSVVETAKRLGVAVPINECIVALIHAMEGIAR